MPYDLSTFHLPSGAHCIRIEWSGVASKEDAEALLKQATAEPLRGLPFLVLTEKMESMSPGARSTFSAQSEDVDPNWVAMVMTNPIIRVSTNFIMRIHRNRRQRMFATEADAIQWLDERARQDAAKPPAPMP